MSLVKKITQIFFLFFLATSLVSCKDKCFEAEEFDSEYLSVEANPVKDLVSGVYDSVNGGQVANWHETGLKSNGQEFIIQISGAWTPWSGQSATEASVTDLPVCNFCAKRSDKTVGDQNCICYKGQSPVAEILKTCDSSSSTQQDDPKSCSCSKTFEPTSSGDYLAASGFKIYHFPLNYYEKDLTTKIADKQSVCKYQAGMGAYIGLFGARGVSDPKRLYHLFSQESKCNIPKNSSGECKDSSGKDRTSYIFRSDNKRIFMKDDNSSNDGTDTNTADDEYHASNEVVKVKIYDIYYNDNYGKYNLEILRGVGQAADSRSKSGLLEFLVGLVEDSLLGKPDSDGVRKNGIIEYMYKSIVQDSGFVKILNVTLCLYVAFFGFAILMGTVEISRKELMMRILKISIVMLFTNFSSWSIYNELIVKLFYDSMNYVIGIFSDLSDRSLSAADSALITNAQMDRAASNSNSTRFSFIDTVIAMLLSEAATAKIFGLFFQNIFGFAYILAIYALIAFFIYVMLTATLVYIINMIKIILVLCLGPVFMCFMLFNQTSSMFKNWIGFLGGRSLEMILMFLVLYNFVTIIDTYFRALLYYRVCAVDYNIGFIAFKRLEADIDRSLAEWISQLFSIAALIYMTKVVMDKIPEFAGGLISIGGVGVGAANAGKALEGGGSGGAGGMMASLAGGVASAANVAFNGTKDGDFGMGRIPGLGSLGSAAMQGGTYLARQSGIAGAVAKVADSIPGLNQISSPRAMMRNQAIDKAIGAAKADAAAQGLTGAAADRHIRGAVTDAMRERLNGDNPGAKRLALAGLDDKTVQDRLDKKLIQDPLKDFIKAKAAEIKARDPAKIPDAKQFRAELRSAAKDWAQNNLSSGAAARAMNHIDKTNKKGLAGGSSHFERDLKNLVKDQGRLKTSEAAKAFKDNPELQNKFMQSLQDNEFRRQKRNEEAGKSIITAVPNLVGRALDALNPTTHHDRNLESAKQAFVRQTQNQQRSWADPNNYNPLNLSNSLNNAQSQDARKEAEQANQKALRSYLSEDSEKMKNNSQNLGAKKDAAKESAEAKSKKDKEKNLKEDKRRALLQRELHKSAVQDLAKEAARIKKLEKKGKFNEAFEEKKKLLAQAKKDLFSKDADKKKSDQPTLFEKAARLSYLQNQFGLGGKEKDAQMLILKEIDEKTKESSSKIKDEIARKTNVESQKDEIIKGNEEPKKDDIIKANEESKKEIERLKDLQSALFYPKIEDEELSKKIEEKIEEKLEKIIKDWESEEPDSLKEKLRNFDSYSTGSEIADNTLAELSSLVASKDLPQDYKKEIAENHEEIIQSQKDNLKNLDEIFVEIKDIETNQLRKEETEKILDEKIEEGTKKAEDSIEKIIKLQKTISVESLYIQSLEEPKKPSERLEELKDQLSVDLGLDKTGVEQIIEHNDRNLSEHLNKAFTEKFNKKSEVVKNLDKEVQKAEILIEAIKELQIFIPQEEKISKASLPENSKKKTEEKTKAKSEPKKEEIEKKIKKHGERLKDLRELKDQLSGDLGLDKKGVKELIERNDKDQSKYLNKAFTEKFNKELEGANKKYTLDKDLPKSKALIEEIKELQIFISQEEALKANLPKNPNKKTEEKAKIKNKEIEKKLKKPNERLKELKAKLSNKLGLGEEKLKDLINPKKMDQSEERNQLIFLNKTLADKFEKDLEKSKKAQELANEKKLREEAKKSREIKLKNQIKKVNELIQQIEQPQEVISSKMDAGEPKQANNLKEEPVGVLILDYNTAIGTFVKVDELKKELFGNLIGDDEAALKKFMEADKGNQFDCLTIILTEKFDKELEVVSKKIDELKNEESSKEKALITPEQKDAEVEKVKESVGLIATSFEVKFGSSITDALLKECDIGLKAGNPFLGVADSDQKGDYDPKKEALYKMNKNQAEGRFKLAKMNLKIAEFELEKLSSDPEKNKRKIAELKAEINSFEGDKNKYEREINEFETPT